MRRTYLARTLAVATLGALAACQDAPTSATNPLAPTSGARRSTAPLPDFAWLAPLGTATTAPGANADTASVVVTVCLWQSGACSGAPVATYTRTSATPVRLDATLHAFAVDWDLMSPTMTTRRTYRIAVAQGATTLGTTLVDALRGRWAPNDGVTVAPLRSATALPIRFWVRDRTDMTYHVTAAGVDRTIRGIAGVATPLDVDGTAGTDAIATTTYEDSRVVVQLESAPGANAPTFVVDATRDAAAADPRTAHVDVAGLPSALVVRSEGNGQHLAYAATAPVSRIAAAFAGDPTVDALDVDLTLQNVGADVDIAFTPTNGVVLASSQSIGQIDAHAHSAGTADLTIPANQGGVQLQSGVGGTAIAVRAFGAKAMNVGLDPLLVSGQVSTSRPFVVSATTIDHQLSATILNTPSQFSLGVNATDPANGGGATVDWSATSQVNQLTLTATGVSALVEQGALSMDARGVPSSVQIAMPTSSSMPLVRVALPNAAGQIIDELRVARGAGTMPATGAANDRFAYATGATPSMALKLTGLMGASIAMGSSAGVDLVLDQNGATTKPIDLDVSLANDATPPTKVVGQLNKPSFHTAITLNDPGLGTAQPIRFALTNGTSATPRTMASLSLNVTNLGTTPTVSVLLTNVPQRLDGCLDSVGGACRPTDRMPGALSNYTGGSPAQQLQPNQMNRPTAASGSMDINDFGTSGTSASISAMVTMNATIDRGNGNTIAFSNLRFHRIAMDGDDNGSFTYKPTVSISAASVPRVYLFIDSNALPFVMNRVQLGAFFVRTQFGTDANPANGNKRLAWAPGVTCGFLGCGVSQSIAAKTSGSLNCGSATEFTITSDIGTVNMFNVPIVGNVFPACG